MIVITLVQPNIKLCNGHANFWVKFHQPQSAIEKGTSQRYQLVVSCQDSTFASLIHAATSIPFEIWYKTIGENHACLTYYAFLSNYRLVVIKQPPSIWYKDEGLLFNTINQLFELNHITGGKENTIQLSAILMASSSESVIKV